MRWPLRNALLAIGVVIGIVLAVSTPAVHAATPSATQGAPGTSYQSPVPVADRRGTEQTLLTFPEWYLVHSPAEYARIVRIAPSHDFPFLDQTGQLWSSYATVTREQLHDHYPLNPGYHVMIWVIASSTTIEYALRSIYENTVGRASWLLGGEKLTDEDRYGAQAAQEYVDFIRQEPWYLFDFSARLHHLWSDVPLWGPGLIRKWERRYALTTEYAIKAVYGKMIEKATRAAYTPALMTTDVVVDHLPDGWSAPTHVSVLAHLPDGQALLALPRYFDFRLAATTLAQQGIHLTDIAGNRSVILVTLWVKDDQVLPATSGRVLFEQPLTMPAHTRRVALLIPVRDLSDFLAAAGKDGLETEHVYDY
ncbi:MULTISPECIES: hypothetical protein [Paraburkholderia]|uniref:hypothetical protein n=1 Tax=Paraburkholderia TaxID=1822464 RepID=UPI00225720A2|nr:MULTISPECIES: hypothetical protein [Paraburkholderia]MCX4162004.1 hypothetical protein [Paraburkholderia megapolitana]MDN7157501.1 hypothetical protein [Paraburkholderia sp. CHISQ3]MDQ6494546.1 hypothetical protein [Paraburkholderia megapolitana]